MSGKSEKRYVHRHHCKGMLKVHLIFVTRFKKPLLKGVLSASCKQAMYSVAEQNGWLIEAIETDKDHVHLLAAYQPVTAGSDMVKKLKQLSTHMMYDRHSDILRQHYWCQNTLWSKGCFYCSIGEVSTDTIQKYIRCQG